VLTRAGGTARSATARRSKWRISTANAGSAAGLIEKDSSGAPNGVIRERNDLYTRLVPRDKPADVRESLLANVRDQLELGITSVIEAGASVDPGVTGSYADGNSFTGTTGRTCPGLPFRSGILHPPVRQRRARRS